MPDEETPVDDLEALEGSGGEEAGGDDAWWKPPKAPLSDNSVVMHRFDHEALGNGMAEAPEFEKEVTEAEKKWATVEKLAEDLFGSMFRFDPTVREAGDITPQYRPNRDMVNQAMGTNEYTELRQFTMGDPMTSLIATKTILEKLLESVPEPVKQAQNQCAEAQGELQKLAQQMQALMQAAAQAQGSTKQGLQKQADQVNQRAQAAQNQAAQAQQNLQKAMQDNAASVRFACRQGIKAAQSEEEETRNLLGGWGMGGGTEQRLSAKERVELAQKLKQNQKLRRVTQVLGKFRRLALSKQRSKLNRNPDKVTSITVGNDLAQVIPSELVALDDEDLEVDFLRRYAEHQLLQYKLEGEEKVGKGPIVVMVDTSGSMGGEPELWAKALALAIVDIARSQDRSAHIAFFGDDTDPIVAWHFTQPTKAPPPAYKQRDTKAKCTTEKLYEGPIQEAVMECAEYFEGGGTSFQRPLDYARRIIDEEKQGDRADILFVTDGYCAVEELWSGVYKEWRVGKKVKLVSIAVIPGVAQVLKDLSDAVFTLENIRKDGPNGYQGTQVAGSVFEMV